MNSLRLFPDDVSSEHLLYPRRRLVEFFSLLPTPFISLNRESKPLLDFKNNGDNSLLVHAEAFLHDVLIPHRLDLPRRLVENGLSGLGLEVIDRERVGNKVQLFRDLDVGVLLLQLFYELVLPRPLQKVPVLHFGDVFKQLAPLLFADLFLRGCVYRGVLEHQRTRAL